MGKLVNVFFSLSDDLRLIDQYAKDGFFIISACDSGCSEKENYSKHKKLCNFIHSQGLRFIEIVGHWLSGKNNLRNEFFLFVPFRNCPAEIDRIGLVAYVTQKFQQESFIYSDPDSSIFFCHSNRINEIREYNFQKLFDEFFKNRSVEYPNIQFIIEGRLIPKCMIGKLYLRWKGYIF